MTALDDETADALATWLLSSRDLMVLLEGYGSATSREASTLKAVKAAFGVALALGQARTGKHTLGELVWHGGGKK